MKCKLDAAGMAKAMEPAVNLLLLRMAKRDLERERVDKIHHRLLAEEFDIRVSREWHERFAKRGKPDWLPGENARILKTDDLHYADLKSPEVRAYYARCDEINKQDGYKLPEGHCPALVADTAVREAEHLLLELAECYFEGDAKLTEAYGENRDKFIDLTIKMVVNAPGYKAPKPEGA